MEQPVEQPEKTEQMMVCLQVANQNQAIQDRQEQALLHSNLPGVQCMYCFALNMDRCLSSFFSFYTPPL